MFIDQTIIAAEASRRTEATRATAASQSCPSTERSAVSALGKAIVRVEGEYREMPGLSLTLPQAARLLGLDRSLCERVLANLIERRVLKRAVNGTYVRQ